MQIIEKHDNRKENNEKIPSLANDTIIIDINNYTFNRREARTHSW